MIGVVILVAAVAVVLLTSLFKDVNWSDKVKNVLASVVSLAAATVAILAGVDFNLSAFAGADVLTLAVTIYGGSQLVYKFIMTGVIDRVINKPLESVGSKN